MLWNIFFWLLPYILCVGFGAYLNATYSGNAWFTLTVSGICGICIGALVYAKYAYIGGHKVGYMKGYTVGYTVGRTHNVELLAALHELWQIAVDLIHNMSFRLGLNEKAICSEEMNAKAEEMTAITIKQTSHQLQSVVSNLNHLSVTKTFEQVGKQVGKQVGSMLGFRAS